ncbi:MAG: hypothetical protein JNG83_14625 [Opitutaceae bacterium]|nr:hypothetical protein [Opitutaceae bacterium]
MRTIRFEKYYSSQERLKSIYDQTARRLPMRTDGAAEFTEWQAEARVRLRTLLGLERMASCPMKPVQLESVDRERYRREKWLIQTEPEVWMPFYVLVPHAIRGLGPAPVMIATHGHRGAGKLSVAGLDEIPAVKAAIEKYGYDYGRVFCEAGYVVFCPDARGFGERREFYFGARTNENELDEEFFLESSCAILNQKAIALGLTLAGMWTWDLMRLIDYISTRPDCDPARVGCAGLSGGGLQLLWLGAFEERVRCMVISGNFFGFRDSIIHQARCSCSYVPRLCEYFDAADLAALHAPRPLLIESGTEDVLSGPRGLANAREQVALARAGYRVLGAEDRLEHHVFAGPHRWDGAQTPAFLRRWLAGPGSATE